MQRSNFIVTTALTAITPVFVVGAGQRRKLGLGKWKDGPPTQIDCSVADSDFSYYIERCWDETTQWWVNGRCIDGTKEEVSELHKCMTPDGGKPYCHDCMSGDGYVKNVCGATNPKKDEVCEVAWAATGKDCGDQEMAAYSHQCKAPAGSRKHWYVREEFDCDEEEVYSSGPNMEEDYPTEFKCGSEWFYEFEDDDPQMAEKYPDLAGMEHAFATGNFCLDCGHAIGVCASSVEATCASLGLPERGMEFPGTLAPWIAPPALFTPPPTPLTSEEVEGDVVAGQGTSSAQQGDVVAGQGTSSARRLSSNDSFVANALLIAGAYVVFICL